MVGKVGMFLIEINTCQKFVQQIPPQKVDLILDLDLYADRLLSRNSELVNKLDCSLLYTKSSS